MKHTFRTAIFLLIIHFSVAATTAYGQVCTWAQSSYSFSNNMFSKIVTDDSGNVYMASNFTGDTLYIGTYKLPNAGVPSDDFYVAKYDSSGMLLWAKRYGGIYHDIVSGIAADHLGHIYITGYFDSPVLTMGAATLTNTTGGAAFVAMLNPAGNIVWAKNTTGGTQKYMPHRAYAITSGPSGEVYITGSYDSAIFFGAISLTKTVDSGTNIFIAKYDSAGNAIWATTSQGKGADASSAIAADAAGNVSITGAWTGPDLSFDTVSLHGGWVSNSNFFLAQFSALGIPRWVRTVDNMNTGSWGESIAIDPSDNIIISGNFIGLTMALGGITLTNAYSGVYTSDLFLAKYSPTGNVLWAQGIGGIGDELISSVVADASGNIYMKGDTYSPSITFGTTTLSGTNLFLARFSASGGPIWAHGAVAQYAYGASCLARDHFNHLYVGGFFTSPLTLDGITISNPDQTSYATFLAQYSNITTAVPTVAAPVADVRLYPNPATTQITVASTAAINTLTITNMLGQPVYTQIIMPASNTTTTTTLNISALPTGPYLLKANGTTVKTFVKQ